MKKVSVTIPLPEYWCYVQDDLMEAIEFCRNMQAKHIVSSTLGSPNQKENHIAFCQYKNCAFVLCEASKNNAKLISVSCKTPAVFYFSFPNEKFAESFCNEVRERGFEIH